ncbi:hypothetical protein GON03_15820 [Nocardioides sp. MAH-18]|uniref:Uncharacterized protein n=1 Tax=Nocardioides agri TaxID=2682843 RepID=A0A6L6XV75_9ACTN|nr:MULTISPECIES: hypothetical protein [unclassified Nocardioides]MBA2955803.1 hypothetical protein [Nocardioides sp. CGMCC 1.13656]MVQ50653.1 hypothetical protein [Nocardioides sp. MAH-18]
MEIIELDASVEVRGDRVLVVGHSLTQLSRGLEPREQVVLRTADADHYAAQVRTIEFELEDTIYTFDVGPRLPENLALERVNGLDAEVHDLSLHELVDLLGELRNHAS